MHAASSPGEFFRIAGRSLFSTLPLAQLASNTGPADLSFTLSDGPIPSGVLVRRFTAQEGVWLDVEQGHDQLLFRFPGMAVFTLERSSGHIVGYMNPDTQGHTLRHLLLDQVVPLTLVSQGEFVLHASGVAVPTEDGSRAVLFIGESGAGKSSVAVGCSLAGAELLADDFVVVHTHNRAATAVPAGVGLRLFDDVAELLDCPSAYPTVAQYTHKKRILDPPYLRQLQEPVPIGAVVYLQPRLEAGAAPQVEPLAPAESLMKGVEHAFRLDLSNVHSHQELLEHAGRLADSVPWWRVSLPDDVSSLVSACQQLVSHVVRRISDKPVLPTSLR